MGEEIRLAYKLRFNLQIINMKEIDFYYQTIHSGNLNAIRYNVASLHDAVQIATSMITDDEELYCVEFYWGKILHVAEVPSREKI